MIAPAPDLPASLRIQVVSYCNERAQVRRLIQSLGAAVDIARDAGIVGSVEVRVGDSTETPELSGLDGGAVEAWCAQAGLPDATYDFFGANLGSAAGNNRLASGAVSDFLLLCNPDTYAAPRMIERLVAAVEPGVGAVESRQVPAEHPKAYDRDTWRTSWVNSSGLLVLRAAFVEVGGLDAEYFFLHGDDVDLSWRLRLAGYELLTAPDAVSFHDKRLTPQGTVVAPDAEKYHHVHSRMMLAERYGLRDIARATRSWVEHHGGEVAKNALEDFDRRRMDGRVPPLLDGADRVATPHGTHLAESRF